MPQYQHGLLPDRHTFQHIEHNGLQQYPMIPPQPNLRVPVGDPASRNSSASNASGVSANSEQRRISVLSLMSPVHELSPSLVEGANGVTSAPNATTYRTHRTPETDARDN